MESDNTTGHKKQELCFKIKFAIDDRFDTQSDYINIESAVYE